MATYLGTLRYCGLPGIVELRYERRGFRYRCFWRFAGCSKLWERSKSKLDALVTAANRCGMSAARADWRPEEDVSDAKA